MEDTLPCYVTRMATRLFESLASPVALSASKMLKEGDWVGLAKLSVDPRTYTNPSTYAADNAACTLLRKLQELPLKGVDRHDAAMQKWWDGEKDCYRTNLRLSGYLPEACNGLQEVLPAAARIFCDARKIITKWIGSRPPELLDGRFGRGGTYSDRGQLTTIPHKISCNPSMTPDAIWFLPQWFGNKWGRSFAQRSGQIQMVHGNRFSTVAKTALIDRCIASEPSINLFYQLALGRALRDRLRSNAGWDLTTAEAVHRRVARVSSMTGEFATLDLSNASDTVAKSLVRILLPPAWFEQLDDLRSKKTLLDDGRWVLLEKFSSMGNGFTFELETIIFAALACAVVRSQGGSGVLGEDVCVYGDDIIVPTKYASAVIPVLRYSGFTLNKEKSFFGAEPFRESCGGDYFDGNPVRGYYLKNLPASPAEHIALHNGIFALREMLLPLGVEIPYRVLAGVTDQLPASVRACRGPQALGDLVLHTQDYHHWTVKVRNSIRYVRVWRPHRFRVVEFAQFKADVVLACATYGTGNRRGGVIPRDGVLGHKVGWVPFS